MPFSLATSAGSVASAVPVTLALETSGFEGSVAVLGPNGLLAERRLQLGGQHGQTLLPELQQLLADLSLTPPQVQLVAVNVGPGSFTGLRVGVVCAKTWAYAMHIDVLGIDTFAAVAQPLPPAPPQVRTWVIVDAQRDELFCREICPNAAYVPRSEAAVPIVPAREWIAQRSAADRVAGPGVARWRESLQSQGVLILDQALVPRARDIGHLAQQAWQAGVRQNLLALEPWYLRRSAAEENWGTRRPGRAEIRPAPTP